MHFPRRRHTQLGQQVRWLQEELDLSNEEVAAMIASAPNLLTISIEGSMAPKLSWLSRRLMLSNEQLAMVVTTCPQVRWVSGSLVFVLSPKAASRASKVQQQSKRWKCSLWRAWFQAYMHGLGICTVSVNWHAHGGDRMPRRTQVDRRCCQRSKSSPAPNFTGRLVRQAASALPIPDKPQSIHAVVFGPLCRLFPFLAQKVLTSSIEGALEPRLKWLQAHLQIGGAVLRERVLACPWLLNLSERGKLAPTYEFLRSELLLDEAEIRKTLFRNPRMFLTPMRQAFEATKKWLCQSVGMQEEEAVKVITRDVRLLLRSTDVLDSKVCGAQTASFPFYFFVAACPDGNIVLYSPSFPPSQEVAYIR